MAATYSQVDHAFQALVDGSLQRRDEVLQALIDVTRDIWRGWYIPDAPAQLEGTSLSRYGYLLETIKLFTRRGDVCRMLNARIAAAMSLVRGHTGEAAEDFLPGRAQFGLADARDELAKFWGLRSGIKVHRIPGFLDAYFDMRDGAGGESPRAWA